MSKGLIGTSLAKCVAEIQKDNVSIRDVKAVFSPTHAMTLRDWKRLFREYMRLYWEDSPAECEEIALRLVATGVVLQPLLVGRWPSLSSDLWINNCSTVKIP